MTYFIVIGVAFIAEEFANYVLSTFFSTAFPSFSKLILNRLRRNFLTPYMIRHSGSLKRRY